MYIGGERMDKTIKRVYILILFFLFLMLSCVIFGTSQYMMAQAEETSGNTESAMTAIYIKGITAKDREYNGGDIVEIDSSHAQFYRVEDDSLVDEGLSISTITGRIDNKNIGVRDVNVSVILSGENCSNYYVDTSKMMLQVNITPKQIAISSLGTQSIEYNGTTEVSLQYEIDDIIQGDLVYLEVSGDVNKKIGNALQLQNLEAKLGGITGHINNYSLQPISCEVFVDIVQKSLTVHSLPIKNKIYDGSKLSSLSYDSLDGVVSGDVVFLKIEGTTQQKEVGNNLNLDITNSCLEGDDGEFYIINSLPTEIKINIVKKELIIDGVEAESREYNGTCDVKISFGLVNGIVAGDVVSIGLRGKVDNKNIGVHKEVSDIIPVFTGRDSENYTFVNTSSIFVDISAKSLTVAPIKSVNRVYDGTIGVDVCGGELDGIINGDQVNISIECQMRDKTVGINKAAECRLSLNGVDAQNYVLPYSSQIISVSIYPRELTFKDFQAVDRVYDSTYDIELRAGDLLNVVEGDNVIAVLGCGRISDKNVGSDKQVDINVLLDGNDATNYVLIQPNDVKVSILKKQVWIVGIIVEDKENDGKTQVNISGGVLIGVCIDDIDKVQFTLGNANFLDAKDGINKEIIYTAALTGEMSENYELVLGNPNGDENIYGTIFPSHMFARVISWVLFVVCILAIGVCAFLFIMHHHNSSQYNVAKKEIAATTTNNDLCDLQDELERQKQINAQQAQQMQQKYQALLAKEKYKSEQNSAYKGMWRKLSSMVADCEVLISQMPTVLEHYSSDKNEREEYMKNIYTKIHEVITILDSINFE